ncbi:diiron oxygenase [Streptomyces sp. NPDC003247]|uniref:diiron oxygenase n=1 Tax=Streptomyces sp. NPDC003247 TaxID=3364677 RepID=UPI0036C54CEA
MCGIIGLFTGCTAVSYCPKRLLTGGPGARTDVDTPVPGAADGAQTPRPAGPEQGEGYRSPFRRWDKRASVRAAPRRELPDDTDGKYFFSPELVPLARHELVRDLRPELFDQVLVQHLYRYLDFTAKLEQVVVNRTALGIAQGTVGLDLHPDMRLDAYRVYCDEAYHALFSADLMRQAERRTGIAPRLPAEPYFLTRLALVQQEHPEWRALAELVFVIVSETLISGSLGEVPDDPRVVPTVREVVRDHALDEGRHHTYFALFLKELWAQSDRTERRLIGTLAPVMVDAFLQPDLPALRKELTGYGLAQDAVEQVLAEVFPPGLVRKTTRDAAQQTVQHFTRLGALDDPAVRAAFETYELV